MPSAIKQTTTRDWPSTAAAVSVAAGIPNSRRSNQENIGMTAACRHTVCGEYEYVATELTVFVT